MIDLRKTKRKGPLFGAQKTVQLFSLPVWSQFSHDSDGKIICPKVGQNDKSQGEMRVKISIVDGGLRIRETPRYSV